MDAYNTKGAPSNGHSVFMDVSSSISEAPKCEYVVGLNLLHGRK